MSIEYTKKHNATRCQHTDVK